MLKKIKCIILEINFKFNYLSRYIFIKENNHKIIKIKKPLILITQIQRSGGSLISQLFDSHSEVYSYPHELYVFDPVWNWNSDKYNFLVYKMPEMKIFAKKGIYYKNTKAKWNKAYNFNFDIYLQKYLFEKNNEINLRKKFDSFFTSFFNSYSNNSIKNNEKFVVSFTPKVNMDYKSCLKFFEIYPDGYMINCIRHPLDWFASANLALTKHSNINKSLNMWLLSTQNSLQLKKRFNNTILVIFEDLILNTEEIMQKISKIIDIKYDKLLTSPSFNGENILSNSSFEAKTGIDKDVIYRKDKFKFNKNIDKDLVSKCLNLYEQSRKISI